MNYSTIRLFIELTGNIVYKLSVIKTKIFSFTQWLGWGVGGSTRHVAYNETSDLVIS